MDNCKITEFKKIVYPNSYHDDNAISNVVSYICQPSKTPSNLIGGVGIDLDRIAESMIAVSQRFGEYSGIRLHHFVVYFSQSDKPTLEMILRIAMDISRWIGYSHQIVFAVHEDEPNLHIHFVFNAVSYIDGYKYPGGMEQYYDIFDFVKVVLHAYNLGPLLPLPSESEGGSIHE